MVELLLRGRGVLISSVLGAETVAKFCVSSRVFLDGGSRGRGEVQANVVRLEWVF